MKSTKISAISALRDIVYDDDLVRTAATPRALLVTLWAMAAFLVLGVLWSVFATVDMTVVARGKTITTAPTISVQPLERSIVREVKVRVGDLVEEGAPLIVLDPTVSAANVRQLQEQAASLKAELLRLEAELSDGAFEAGAGPDEILQAQILDSRRREYASTVAAKDEKIRATEFAIRKAENNLTALTQRHTVNDDIEAIFDELYNVSKVGSKLQLLRSKDQRMEIESELNQQRDELNVLRHELESSRGEREAFVRKWHNDAYTQLVKTRRDHDSAVQDLAKAQLADRMVILKAPRQAVVLEVSEVSVGSVVREAEPMLKLVPIDVPIEVEAQVSSGDIAHVAIDQPVRIKLDALPFQKHGELMGAVRTISESSFQDDEQQQQRNRREAAATENLHYAVRVSITADQLRAQPEAFRLLPGMTLTADIRVGQRRVIEYFLYPILRGLDESFREP